MKLLLKQRTAALAAGTWGWGDAEPPAAGDLARIKASSQKPITCSRARSLVLSLTQMARPANPQAFAKRALSEMVYDEVQSRTGAITAQELQANPRSNKREVRRGDALISNGQPQTPKCFFIVLLPRNENAKRPPYRSIGLST